MEGLEGQTWFWFCGVGGVLGVAVEPYLKLPKGFRLVPLRLYP